jgi:hypothetical protein
METLNQMFDAIAAALQSALINPLLTESLFRSGFFWGLAVAFVIGSFSRVGVSLWNQVLQFFGPSQKPATNPGPSSFSQLTGCLGAAIGLAIGGAFVILLVTAMRK